MVRLITFPDHFDVILPDNCTPEKMERRLITCAIEQAREGDGDLLADLIRAGEPWVNNPELRAFLANVVAGHIRLKPRRKGTHAKRLRSHARERWVDDRVAMEMLQLGKQRDDVLRKQLVEKYCKLATTKPEAVAEFLKRRSRS